MTLLSYRPHCSLSRIFAQPYNTHFVRYRRLSGANAPARDVGVAILQIALTFLDIVISIR